MIPSISRFSSDTPCFLPELLFEGGKKMPEDHRWNRIANLPVSIAVTTRELKGIRE
jgi:hypothetical protein